MTQPSKKREKDKEQRRRRDRKAKNKSRDEELTEQTMNQRNLNVQTKFHDSKASKKIHSRERISSSSPNRRL
jgi:hypothetical protein